MWILFVVLVTTSAISSEQIYFGDRFQCETQKSVIEKHFPNKALSRIRATCLCLEVEQ